MLKKLTHCLAPVFLFLMTCCPQNSAVSKNRPSVQDFTMEDSFTGQVVNKSESCLIKGLALSYEFSSFFELDDKYSDSEDKEEIDRWWNQRKNDLLLKNLAQNTYDIFNHNGGGPNGAEWNSYADIYCVAVIDGDSALLRDLKEDASDMSVTIYLNDKPLRYRSPQFHIKSLSGKDHLVLDFFVEKEVWIYALRKIFPGDCVLMFGKSGCKAIQTDGIPVEAGKVAWLTVKCHLPNGGALTINNYIHWAEGE
jgi:hypothetical protein